ILRHSRLRPSGSSARNSTISAPNITRRRLGMIFARSACDKNKLPTPSRNQRVAIGSKVTKTAPKIEPSTEPADDDHGQVVDRDVDLFLLVVGAAEIVSVQNPSDAGVERRDRERDQLVAEDVDADELGGDVVVADRDEGAADAAARQVDGGNDRERCKEQQEQIEMR